MTRLKVQIVRNFTVEPLLEVLGKDLKLSGFELEAEVGAYGNQIQEILTLSKNPDKPDVLILALHMDYFSAGLFSPRWSIEDAKSELNALFHAIDSLPEGIFTVVSTFVSPVHSNLPLPSPNSIAGRDDAAGELNRMVSAFVVNRTNKCGILDFQKIAARLGEKESIDQRFGLMMKVPFKPAFFEAASQEVLRFIRARARSPKKVLVLDCDNTLWGGVVGEAGLEGIDLDPYEYPGVAYYRFQHSVLRQVQQGVLLCLCSKNDESAVMDVLAGHPHCQIKSSHLAASRINWLDKATNIKSLAKELNLSTDSMVFIDDSPVECDLIRQALPEVTVVQVPSKTYLHPDTLRNLDVFDKISISREDSERLVYYQAEKARKEVESTSLDPREFLAALEMKAVIRAISPKDLTRASQLCQRTNQFNLTTKRYSEQDLSAFSEREDMMILLLEASDKFGPIGTSGLLIFEFQKGVLNVDTFLMSCRIIGRKFDRALFFKGLQMAFQKWRVESVVAGFEPTAKNGLVKTIYADYGLASDDDAAGKKFRAAASKLDISLPEEILIVDNL